jgi:hypothetical protein
MKLLKLTIAALCATTTLAVASVATAEEAHACRDYDGHKNSVVPPDCGGGGYAGGSASGGSVSDAIYATWPASLASTAEAVATCESGLDPAAYNPASGAFGAFQFLPTTEAGADGTIYGALDDPYYAAAEAYELYLDAGWSPWVCA